LFFAGTLIISPETNSKLNLELDPCESNFFPHTGIRIESLVIDIPSTDDEFKNSMFSLIAL